jgi:hypothetical protein
MKRFAVGLIASTAGLLGMHFAVLLLTSGRLDILGGILKGFGIHII